MPRCLQYPGLLQGIFLCVLCFLGKFLYSFIMHALVFFFCMDNNAEITFSAAKTDLKQYFQQVDDKNLFIWHLNKYWLLFIQVMVKLHGKRTVMIKYRIYMWPRNRLLKIIIYGLCLAIYDIVTSKHFTLVIFMHAYLWWHTYIFKYWYWNCKFNKAKYLDNNQCISLSTLTIVSQHWFVCYDETLIVWSLSCLQAAWMGETWNMCCKSTSPK